MPIALSQFTDTANFAPVSAPCAFAAMVRPHVLFIDDASIRQRLVDACVHAWNIGFLNGPREREAAIESVGREAAVAAAEDPSCTRVASSEIAMLHALVDQRRRSFPFLGTVIQDAQLTPGPSCDRLEVLTPSGRKELQVTWRPTLADLVDVRAALSELCALLPVLQANGANWAGYRLGTHDTWATRAANRCRLLQLELSTYRAMLSGINGAVLHEAEGGQIAHSFAQIEQIQHWVQVFLNSLATQR